MQTRTLFGIIAILLAVSVLASTVSAYYYYEYSHEVSVNASNKSELNYLLTKENLTLSANLLIDYGNGTLHWYNSTIIQPDENMYVGTVVATGGNVNATYYPQYQEHFVTAINGVAQTSQVTWSNWLFNDTTKSWTVPLVGPDLVVMQNASSYAWTYCGYNSTTYLPTCTP
ncbi:MAG: hypothetical protein ACYCQJ_04985 [Nitrososphaerales archaeon]